MIRLRLLIIGLILWCSQSIAQINEFHYWFDDDFANLQTQTFTLSPENANVISNLDVSSLDIGVHSLHYRFLDNNGMYSVTNSHLFWKTTAFEAPASREITKYEYWYDDNLALLQSVDVLNQENILISSDFDVSALNDGVHILHLRFLDSERLWSSVISHIFHKTTSVISTPATAIIEYQYWYNDDFATAQTIMAGGSMDFTLISDMDISALSQNLNVFHIRFKDDLGNWSSVKSSLFFITNEPELPVMINLNNLEYWYDDDFENRESIALSNHDENWIETLDLSALQSGLHTMSFRVCDENMLWSSVKTNFFHLVEVEVPLFSNPIKRIRYWIDDDFDNHQIMEISTLENDILFAEDIPLFDIPAGEYVFRYQFQDSIGTWSVPMFDTIQKEAYPWISVNLLETNFCGSGEFIIAYDTSDVSSISWDFGDGTGETGFSPTHVYAEAGIFSPEVSVTHEGTGQTIVYDIADDIHVNPEYSFDSTRVVCSGDSVLFQGNYYYESGEFEVNHINMYGCDSTFTMFLYENPVNEVYLIENICEGDSLLFDGIYLQESGNYQLNLNNQYFCDSIVYLDFIINPTPETPFITQDADTLLTSDYEMLYWYFNDELIDGENDSSLVCDASGDYFVIAGNTFSCLSDSSEVINVILTGMQTGENIELSVFPNPVKDDLYIELSAVPKNSVKYSLISISGKHLRKGVLTKNRSCFDVSTLVPGTYILLMEFENRTQSIKIIKQ